MDVYVAGWSMVNESKTSPLNNLRRGQNSESTLELPLLASVLLLLAFAETGLPVRRASTTERTLRGGALRETLLFKRYVGASRGEKHSLSPLVSTAVDMYQSPKPKLGRGVSIHSSRAQSRIEYNGFSI